MTRRELPLLLKGPLVRATIEGRKTQTRRPMRNQPPTDWVASPWPGDPQAWSDRRCPWSVGDWLYVRETHGCSYVDIAAGRPRLVGGTWGSPARPGRIPCVVYRADGDSMPDDSPGETARWTPSIHMPKWAARVWLEVTGVRVERVQDITDSDAYAEGFADVWDDLVSREEPAALGRERFLAAWASIYGPGNPWVWVIDYKLLSTTGRPA